MRYSLYYLILIFLLASCKKDVIKPEEVFYQPKMKVKEFNLEVSKSKNFLSLDMDGNGFGDVTYSAHFVYDRDLPGHKVKFYATGSNHTAFPLNSNNPVQETLILKKGDIIDRNSFTHPYAWTNYPFVLLATKYEPYFDKPVFWDGKWKDLSHVYQAFSIGLPTGLFYGWVEISIDTAAEKLIVHTGAISTESEKGVKAGVR